MPKHKRCAESSDAIPNNITEQQIINTLSSACTDLEDKLQKLYSQEKRDRNNDRLYIMLFYATLYCLTAEGDYLEQYKFHLNKTDDSGRSTLPSYNIFQDESISFVEKMQKVKCLLCDTENGVMQLYLQSYIYNQ